ncbi:MAG: hypothetical protein J5604_02780 [Bacteroidales bacterium]|nr:hypothetical protein [Bacteroidales bacterium]
MNLFIFPYQSENFYTCPDTAVNQSGKGEYWVPDGIDTLRAIPFVYVRINRAAKCSGADYAFRHYSQCGYGIHLTSYDVNEGNTLDSSIFISGSTPTEGSGPYPGFEAFDSAIERASQYMSLRSGDIIALELEDCAAYEVHPGGEERLDYKELIVKILS